MSKEDEIDDFEGEAVERLEAFINSMLGDRRFVIPIEEYEEGPVEDHWSHVYTSRGSRLIERMMKRLSKLAERKFGYNAAFNIDISTCLYQEL